MTPVDLVGGDVVQGDVVRGDVVRGDVVRGFEATSFEATRRSRRYLSLLECSYLAVSGGPLVRGFYI